MIPPFLFPHKRPIVKERSHPADSCPLRQVIPPACVKAVCEVLTVSERRAGNVLGQYRSTQRHVALGKSDDHGGLVSLALADSGPFLALAIGHKKILFSLRYIFCHDSNSWQV
jgi:hypothetical protein